MANIKEKLVKATTLEEKMWVIHSEFSIPVRASYGSWDGFEIRLTQESDSVCYGPMRWKVNVDDVDLIERLAGMFRHIDHTMLSALNKVWGCEHLGMHIEFMKECDIDEMLHRWDRFNKWVGKYYPDYQKKSFDRKFDWLKHQSLPDNSVAWAARVILYGIKPSKIGLKLFKEHKAEITESGILKLTEDSNLVSRWHFSDATGAVDTIDSFGLGGCIGAAIQKAFGDEKDIIECDKIPEEWEIEANVFIGLKEKKKSLLRNKK